MILDFESTAFGDEDDWHQSTTHTVATSFLSQVSASPRNRNEQNAFFQACGLPAAFVEHLHLADADRSIVRAVTQWRLDFPYPLVEGIPNAVRGLLSVAEDLLTRGATPLCSPRLEDAIREVTEIPDDAEAVVEAARRVALAPSCRYRPGVLDSPSERSLFEWVEALIERENMPWSLLPQVELASLSPTVDPASRQRGDLLLTHPTCPPVLIEVDDASHESHQQRDTVRDRELAAAGVRVIRIPVDELRDRVGPTIELLHQILVDGRVALPPETDLSRMVRWCKFLHQIQIALLVALRGGWLDLNGVWNVGVIPPASLLSDARAATLIPLAVADLQEMLGQLARLHDRPLTQPSASVVIGINDVLHAKLDVLIGPGDGSIDDLPTTATARFLVSDICVPVEVQAPLTGASPARLQNPSRDVARWFLQYLFRKEDFREGQWETIERTLRGLDSVVLLPTGAGKSIAFQLAALLLPGRCLVVDPIVSLIDDQIDNLERVGIDRCIGLTSRLTTDERNQALRALKSGHYLFCYVAPERFQTVAFRNALRALTTATPISLIAIDEAHCVSEWGHDFRTAYLNLGRITRDYCTSQGAVPPLLALTGTASKIVLKDVQRELGITSFDALITPKTFDRPELQYTVLHCQSAEKVQRVIGFLDRLPTDFAVDRNRFFRPAGRHTLAGLVFCPHVNGQYGIVEQARQLSEAVKVPVGVYSGEPPRGVDRDTWEKKKTKVARDFKRDRTTVLACTKAFGMGIDKPNIRYTVHIGLPSSIESFYQEAGRAGRDGRRSECAIIISNDDPQRTVQLLKPETPLDELAQIVKETDRQQADDIVRALWFHLQAFRGEEEEINDIATLLDLLGDTRRRHQVNISWRLSQRWGATRSRDDGRERMEKALHRLVILGVVEDYTVDYAAGEFSVRIAGATQEQIAAAIGRYAGAYQLKLGEETERSAVLLRQEDHRAYILAVARLLIHFIYQHVEQARRRALNEMFQAANRATTSDALRHRILIYLEQSEWDQRLEPVRGSARGGVDALASILDDVVTPRDAVALRAAAGRALAAYPDVPGLLLLRSLSEALSPDADPEVVRQDLVAAMRFASEDYKLQPSEIAVALGQAVSRACDKSDAAELLLDSILGSPFSNRVLLCELMRAIPITVAHIPARRLLHNLAVRCATLTSASEGG